MSKRVYVHTPNSARYAACDEVASCEQLAIATIAQGACSTYICVTLLITMQYIYRSDK